MKIVPQAFYQQTDIEKILKDGLSCIVRKNVTEANFRNPRYLASHALTLVLNGTLRVETFDGDLTLVEKNHMILIPKGLYMTSDLIPKKGSFEALVFFFDQELTCDFLANFNPVERPKDNTPIIITYTEPLQLFTSTLLTLYQYKRQHQFTRAKLLEFLHLISLSKEGDAFIHKLQSLKHRERKNIKAFMAQNYDKPLEIEDYAYLTGRSISTFRRDFKSRFGISPKKWLIEKRLEKVAQLLKEKSDTITDIALQVGYTNTSHFIKAFQKQYGISPKQLQLQYRLGSL